MAPTPPNKTVAEAYVWPMLAAVSAISLVTIASASLATYTDVQTIKSTLNLAIKDQDETEKEIKRIDAQVRTHEIRLIKGKL